MKFIQGQDRSQTHLFPVSIDQAIDADNEVRLIDLFVDSLDLENIGFDKHFVHFPSIVCRIIALGVY